MSASASRDARRMSVTRMVHRRLSGVTREFPNKKSFDGLKKVQPQSSVNKPNMIRRYFATVPDANKKYLPVPKALKKAHERSNMVQRSWLAKIRHAVRTRLPFIDFIKSYDVRQNLISDLVSGFAVTGMHFPQGLAYGLLAGLTPAIGMISTIFPVFVYMFFGSSAHTSIGTNAIVSIIVGNLLIEPEVKEHIDQIRNSHLNLTISSNETIMNPLNAMNIYDVESEIMKYKISLVAGVTFFTGIIFLLMAAFRMGFMVTYLSQSFMSGFTTGVAVHIFSSQVKTALGVKVPPVQGAGQLVMLYYNVFKNIGSANVGDIVVTIVCVVILLLVKILVNERLKLKVPIPIDFILLVIATIISTFAKLPETYNIKALGKVEMGIPAPAIPTLQPVGTIIRYAIEISLITFFLNISVCKIIARRNGYEINENVETNAYGMCNIVAAFFSNIPASIAPPRSTLLSSMGSKTTLNAVSTTGVMLLLIYYFGQFFEKCPQAVLASMIMVAMKDLLKQVNVLPKLWKVNKNDFTTWLIAASVCVFIDISYGLVLGVLVSLLSVINQSQRGWISVLGKSETEDLYLDHTDYVSMHELPHIKIVRMESSLYFATAEKFRKGIYKIIEKEEETDNNNENENEYFTDNNKNESEKETMIASHDVHKETILEEEDETEAVENEVKIPIEDPKNKPKHTKVLIIDCIPINFIDGTGLDMLKLVIFELSCIDIAVYLARCSRYMLHLLEKSDIYETYARENVFIDLPDAVHAAVTFDKTDTVATIHEEVNEVKPLKKVRSRIMSFSSMDSAELPYDRFLRSGSIYQL